MQITGVSLDQFNAIVNVVSAAKYSNNLVVHQDARDLGGVRRPRIRARVTVRSTGAREGLPKGKTLRGVRTSSSYFNQGSRIHAACWHAYRDVLVELFNHFPDAVVTTAAAKYNGQKGFNEYYPATYYQNIGAMISPVLRGEACKCDED